MSNFHALNVTTTANINAPIVGVVVCVLVVGGAVAIYEKIANPHPTGYICPSVDGVVGRISHINKVGRPFYIDGVKVSREEYEACIQVELPHP